jgi:hypothetical protein
MGLSITWCKQLVPFKIIETKFIEQNPYSKANSMTAGPIIPTSRETQRKDTHEALGSASRYQHHKATFIQHFILRLPLFYVL